MEVSCAEIFEGVILLIALAFIHLRHEIRKAKEYPDDYIDEWERNYGSK